MCTRGRPEILEQNIINIKHLAKEPSEVEILLGIDLDDHETQLKVDEITDNYGNIRSFVKPRFKNLHQFYNFLSVHAEGKYIWGMNDDSLMEYADFDVDFANQIESLLSSYTDRIGYFAIESNSSDKMSQDYGEFPIVTREALKTLGFMDCEDLKSWGCDQIMYNIYNSVGRAFKLKVDRPMRHVYHSEGSVPNPNRDDMIKVFKEEFGENWNEAVGNMQKFVNDLDLSPYSAKLLEKINASSSSL